MEPIPSKASSRQRLIHLINWTIVLAGSWHRWDISYYVYLTRSFALSNLLKLSFLSISNCYLEVTKPIQNRSILFNTTCFPLPRCWDLSVIVTCPKKNAIVITQSSRRNSNQLECGTGPFLCYFTWVTPTRVALPSKTSWVVTFGWQMPRASNAKFSFKNVWTFPCPGSRTRRPCAQQSPATTEIRFESILFVPVLTFKKGNAYLSIVSKIPSTSISNAVQWSIVFN